MLVVILSVVVFVSYIALYTAYSKKSKTLEMALLVEVFTMSKSFDHTLVEMNKAASLSGLTLLCVAFLPFLEAYR